MRMAHQLLAWVAAGLVLSALVGCPPKEEEPPPKKERYESFPKRDLPPYLRDSILEITDVLGAEPLVVSGFGLVVNLRDTGGGPYPNTVRNYMISEMDKRGFGRRDNPQFRHLRPESVLQDPRVTVVRVDAYIPPGARKGQTFDVQVSALAGSEADSLAGGRLYETDLRIDGANPANPAGSIHVYARGAGSIFVNPAYALQLNPTTPAARTSLRQGTVLDGGMMSMDRPLVLRLRQPQAALARQIERRIDQHFQDPGVAAALDEALVQLLVPVRYEGNWEHFLGVVTHLYMNSSAGFQVNRARELVEAARQPDAPLLDISFAWEAMGSQVLPIIAPLYSDPAPEVAYAAARAGALLDDFAAQQALLSIARTEGHAFQLSAISALGMVRTSPRLNRLLRELLDSPNASVRVQAYQVLARNRDDGIFSKVIRDKFVLDIVRSAGEPIVFVTRTGVPRIAIIGSTVTLDLPIVFSAIEQRFSISSNNQGNAVTLFFRSGKELPLQQLSTADLAEIVARLAGEGAEGERRFDFSYSDVVAILQRLGSVNKLVSLAPDDRHPVSARLMIQDPPQLQSVLRGAPAVSSGQPSTLVPGLPDFQPDSPATQPGRGRPQ